MGWAGVCWQAFFDLDQAKKRPTYFAMLSKTVGIAAATALLAAAPVCAFTTSPGVPGLRSAPLASQGIRRATNGKPSIVSLRAQDSRSDRNLRPCAVPNARELDPAPCFSYLWWF